MCSMFGNCAAVLAAVTGLLSLGCTASLHQPLVYAANSVVQVPPGPPHPQPAPCRRVSNPARYGGPVCGTDDVTYHNHMFLTCRNKHLPAEQRAQVSYLGSCMNSSSLQSACERNMLYTPICGSDNQTYANVEAMHCNNKLKGQDVTVLYEGECQTHNCPCRRKDPMKVCASNGLTYASVREVACLKRYNPELHILHAGGCTVREVRAVHGRRFACHLARNRYEWNPVCSQSNQTYANPYVYICHRPPTEKKCGARWGECGTLRQLACMRADRINRRELESSSLVCGSSGVTYRSYEHLHCATATDIHLEAISTGRCSRNYDPCAVVAAPLLGRGDPVCGSDNRSYISVQALWCVKRLNRKDLRFKHDGPCI